MNTKNINQNLLSLFARHPNYLLRLFFTYYPLSNEQIVKFKGEVKWGHLSSNSVRSWDQSFIAEYADQLNWDALSGNPSLPWTISFLKSFPGKFKGSIQSMNPSLPWSYEFITKYEQFWNFHSLPLNKGIPWTQKLVLHPKIIDKNLSTVNDENLWTEEFLIRNAEILHWELLCANQHIKWSEELIDKLSTFWRKAERKSSEHTVSPWKGLCSNPSVPWTAKFIKKYQKSFFRPYGIHWKELSRNPNLPWQEENLLEIYKNKWNWDLLSVNNGVGFSEEQIERYQSLLTWDSGSASNQNIASNNNLPWSVEFIEKYKHKWHWWSLSRNTGVNWTEEMISTFEENIIWQSMAHNLNLPWSIEFILKHEDVLFKSWSSTNRDFDQHIWKKVFEPIITDEIAEQILYNLSNPFQAIKNYNPETDDANIPQKNLEILTRLILNINSQTNPYISNFSKIDLFLSAIQTAMTQILIADENELKIDLKLLTELYQESDVPTKKHLNSLCAEVHEEIRVLFVGYGIDNIAREVILKQNEMNETYMEFARQGGHVSQDYSFLHSFIRKYGKRHLELARLWVLLETLQHNK
jgi:hypothetical protein